MHKSQAVALAASARKNSILALEVLQKSTTTKLTLARKAYAELTRICVYNVIVNCALLAYAIFTRAYASLRKLTQLSLRKLTQRTFL